MEYKELKEASFVLKNGVDYDKVGCFIKTPEQSSSILPPSLRKPAYGGRGLYDDGETLNHYRRKYIYSTYYHWED